MKFDIIDEFDGLPYSAKKAVVEYMESVKMGKATPIWMLRLWWIPWIMSLLALLLSIGDHSKMI